MSCKHKNQLQGVQGPPYCADCGESVEFPKIPASELIRLAFLHAEQDIGSLVESTRGCPEHDQYKDLWNQLNRYRLKRWGKTAHELAIENSTKVDIRDLKLRKL